MRLWGLLGALLLATAVCSQEGTSDVIPSEDELAEAFDRGDLSIADFVRLQELQQAGADSVGRYIYDYADNVSLVGNALFYREPSPDYQSVKHRSSSRRYRLLFRQRYARRDDETSGARSRSYIAVRYGSWRADLNVWREFDGRKRVRSRRLEFTPRHSVVKRLVVGNYVTRFGLGSVIGYRGKLTSPIERLSTESMLFPDYSGYNGLLLECGDDAISGTAMLSFQRDESHAIRVGAGAVTTTEKGFTGGLLLSNVRITNRQNDRSNSFHRLGAVGRLQLDGSCVAAEASVDPNHAAGVALIVEGQHQTSSSDLSGAFWRYGERFVDLTAGSKSISLRSDDSIPALDYQFSTRRRGQTGGMMQVETDLTDSHRMFVSGYYGQLGATEYEVFLRAGGIVSMGQADEVRVEYLTRHRSQGRQVSNRYETRFSWRHGSNTLWWRVQASYKKETERTDRLALFARGNWTIDHDRSVAWWLHLSEIDRQFGAVGRWYGYVSLMQSLMDQVSVDIKISHRFRHSSARSHTTQIQLSLEARV